MHDIYFFQLHLVIYLYAVYEIVAKIYTININFIGTIYIWRVKYL